MDIQFLTRLAVHKVVLDGSNDKASTPIAFLPSTTFIKSKLVRSKDPMPPNRVLLFCTTLLSLFLAPLSATAALPNAPNNLLAQALSSTNIQLSWLDNSGNEAQFKLERAPDKWGLPGKWTQIAVVSANVTSYIDSYLTNNTRYWYRVRASNLSGNSPYSNLSHATTLPLPPAAPSELTSTPVSSSSITLSWQDNSPNENGFTIERTIDDIKNCGYPDETSWVEVGSTQANISSFSDGRLDVSLLYWYRVKAFNAGGNSYSGNLSALALPLTRRISGIDAGFYGLHDQSDIAALTPTKWTRYTAIKWNETETAENQFNWCLLDAIKRQAQQMGIQAVLVLQTGKPNEVGWPPLTNCTQKYCPIAGEGDTYQANLSKWQRFLETLYQRYRGVFSHYQVGNEWSARGNERTMGLWGGTSSHHLDLLRSAQVARSSVQANEIIIILGGLVSTENQGRCYIHCMNMTVEECALTAHPKPYYCDPTKDGDFKYQDDLLSHPELYDWVDIHLYKYLTYDPLVVEDSVIGIKKKLESLGAFNPIGSLEWHAAFGHVYYPDSDWWFNEITIPLSCDRTLLASYPNAPRCDPTSQDFQNRVKFFEAEQGSDFVKLFTSMLEQGMGQVSTPMIYQPFADYSYDHAMFNYQGIIRRDPLTKAVIAKKPSYHNYVLLYEALTGFTKAKKLSTGAYSTYKFIVGNKPIYIVWSPPSNSPITQVSSELAPLLNQLPMNVLVTKVATDLDDHFNPIFPLFRMNLSRSLVPLYVDSIPLLIELP